MNRSRAACPGMLPIFPGWGYAGWHYQLDQEVIDGTWRFPKAPAGPQ